jgi:hypothetical protein
MAWEIFPGRTPYTRGSELQNAETSAWGRAIIAVGAADAKRGIASRQEVEARRAERDHGPVPDGVNVWQDSPPGQLPPVIPGTTPPEDAPGSIDGKQRTRLQLVMRDLGVMDKPERIAQWVEIIGRPIESGNDLSFAEAAGLLRHYEPLAADARKAGGKL